MKSIKLIVGVLSALTVLSACTKNDRNSTNEHKQHISIQEIEASAKSNQEYAEQLALAAEKMALNPGGFFYADELLSKALSIDPQNTRALFYKSIIQPFMVQRGMWARVAPWVANQTPEYQEQYRQTIAEMPQSGTKNFLLDGKPDIATMADWQSQLAVTRKTLLDARNIMQSLKRKVLEANFTVFAGASNLELIKACSPIKLAEGVYEIVHCPYQTVLPLKISRPDFEAISLSLTSFAAGYTWIFTAYSFEGAERVAEAFSKAQENREPLDYPRILSIIRSEPNFLKLRDPQALKDILNLGTEGMEALQYALRSQPELCRFGHSNPNNRPGYINSNGYCTDAEGAHTIVTLNAFLSGPFQIVKELESQDPNGLKDRYLTELNVEKVLQNPIPDLRDLLPTEVNPATGKIRFADDSLGGLFPNNDASDFFNYGYGRSSAIVPASDLK